MKKTIVPVVLTAAVTSIFTLWGISKFSDGDGFRFSKGNTPVHYASDNGITGTQPVDFSAAAQATVKSVVHIKTMTEGRNVVQEQDENDPFSFFFGPRSFNTPQREGSGSGVIISPDGYIITNNHVVDGADKVQVTFNTRSTQIAKVVGTDPSTDLAVLKIEGNNLPYITMGNSDNVQLGQWVLAVGYPLNLDATVTAGIVSAKSRSIGINRRQNNSAIESFIQTDAAVNPGNSGGALVTADGQLVGINSAIASPTGTYAGYSYAIPSNLVQKVVNDLIKFGNVKRGYLGVSLQDLNSMDREDALKMGVSADAFDNGKGVYVAEVTDKGGAKAAGIRKGDFITGINGKTVSSTPELMEQIARFHPGDKITLNYDRNSKPYSASVELKEDAGALSVDAGKGTAQIMGASIRTLTEEETARYRIKGAIVVDPGTGLLAKNSGIKKGFVIMSVNDTEINSVADLQSTVSKTAGQRVEIGGTYLGRGGMYYYGFNNSSEGAY